MHRFFHLLILLLLFGITGNSQYFQQDIVTHLDVRVDDDLETINAKGSILYTNNSKVILDTIYFHVWANAFKDINTAFSEQQLKLQNTEFHFSDNSKRGGFKELIFDENVGKWMHHADNPDMGFLVLNTPLEPGGTLKIQTSFSLKLPHQFSRLGIKGEYIQLTHWLPKPAVYDQSGWHWFPYLAMGEFYSEYGSYDISLSAPELLKVVATGTIEVVPQDDGRISYSIKAAEVIDMAIVMHPHYILEQESLKGIKGDDIILKIFRDSNDKIWSDSAMQYLKSSVEYFEKVVGPYPYPHLTLVQQKGSGGGMEYPMLITVSANDYKTLNYYINHEVGHQWFYGILAFNEREEPFLDEGLTTFFEHLYTIEKRGLDYHTSNFPNGIIKDLETPILQQGYLWQKRRSFSEPGNVDPQNSSMINYGVNAYEKAAYVYQYLYSYLGREVFISAIQSFYELWKSKHPYLNDLIDVFETVSGKTCDWIAPLLTGDPVVDFKITKISGSMIVVNNGNIQLPFQVTDISGQDLWFKPLEPGSSVDVGSDILSVNDKFLGLEIDGDNNHIDHGKITMIPILGIDNTQKKEIFFIPLATWNYSDGLSFGAAVYNSTFPSRKFQYLIAPQVGLSSGDLTGNSWLAYNLYPESEHFRKIQFKLSAKRYNYFFNERNDYRLNYTRITPQVSFHFRSQPNSQKYSKVTLRSIILNKQLAEFTGSAEFNINSKTGLIHQLKYEFFDFNILNRKELSLIAEQRDYSNSFEENESYIKLTGKFKYQYQYNKGKSIFFQLFASGFLKNTQRGSSSFDPEISAGAISLFHQGFNDYSYEEYFLNRQQGDGPFTNQVSSTMGGFKDALGPQYGIGQSNHFAVSAHFSVDLPMNLPSLFKIRPYVDVGYYRSKLTNNSSLTGNTIYSGGLMLSYLDGSLEIYFPLFSSKAIRNIYSELGENIFQRISFSIDFHRINPWDLIDDLNF